jgi:hypothetical protein
MKEEWSLFLGCPLQNVGFQYTHNSPHIGHDYLPCNESTARDLLPYMTVSEQQKKSIHVK